MKTREDELTLTKIELEEAVGNAIKKHIVVPILPPDFDEVFLFGRQMKNSTALIKKTAIATIISTAVAGTLALIFYALKQSFRG